MSTSMVVVVVPWASVATSAIVPMAATFPSTWVPSASSTVTVAPMVTTSASAAARSTWTLRVVPVTASSSPLAASPAASGCSATRTGPGRNRTSRFHLAGLLAAERRLPVLDDLGRRRGELVVDGPFVGRGEAEGDEVLLQLAHVRSVVGVAVQRPPHRPFAVHDDDAGEPVDLDQRGAALDDGALGGETGDGTDRLGTAWQLQRGALAVPECAVDVDGLDEVTALDGDGLERDRRRRGVLVLGFGVVGPEREGEASDGDGQDGHHDRGDDQQQAPGTALSHRRHRAYHHRRSRELLLALLGRRLERRILPVPAEQAAAALRCDRTAVGVELWVGEVDAVARMHSAKASMFCCRSATASGSAVNRPAAPSSSPWHASWAAATSGSSRSTPSNPPPPPPPSMIGWPLASN